MLRLIATRDVIEFLRDGRLLWAGGLVTVLLFTALAVGWQQQRTIDSERAAAQTLDYDDWLKQSAKHPHDAAHQGMHVFKPAPALSLVDPGIEPYVGSTIWLQAHRQSEMKFRPAQDATGLQRFGNLSVAWVLQILGPLLVIVLGFNAFAGEREQGTLRQTLSLGVPVRRLLWGKALALGASVAALLIPVLIAAAIAVSLGAQEGQRVDALLRLAGLTAGYAFYFGIAIFLVLAVSAYAPSSRVALIVLLGLWIAGVVLTPRIASDVASLAYPSPNRLQFNAALDGDLSAEKKEVWMKNFGVESPWSPEVPLNKWGIALRVDDRVGYGVMDKHFEHLWDSFDKQQRAQEWPGLIIPLLALRGFSMGLAGTDFAHHRDFAVAAEHQRRVMQDIISEDLVEHADPLGDQHFSYKAASELWHKVPRFSYTAPDVGYALSHNARSLMILTLGFALAIGFAHIVAGRRLLARQ